MRQYLLLFSVYQNAHFWRRNIFCKFSNEEFFWLDPTFAMLSLSCHPRGPWGCATERWGGAGRPTCQTSGAALCRSRCNPALLYQSALTFRYDRNPPPSPPVALSVIRWRVWVLKVTPSLKVITFKYYSFFFLLWKFMAVFIYLQWDPGRVSQGFSQ